MNTIDEKDVSALLTGTTEEKKATILKLTKARLLRLLGMSDGVTDCDVPYQFNDVLVEVTIKRFNRISNEGMTSYSQEGESLNFADSDFDEYMDEINDYRKSLETSNGFGKVRFL